MSAQAWATSAPTAHEATGAIVLEQQGALAVVTLSNAHKHNAMSRSMWHQLAQAFMALAQDASVRAVVVRGAGEHFCAGGDIAQYPAFRFDEASLRRFHEDEVWGGLSALLNCPVPLLAQIDGNCMGAGLEIAACCDVRIASTRAQFAVPIARLGFPMAPREAQLLVSRVGASVATQMLLEAAVLDADRLHGLGFLHTVVSHTQLADAVLQRAQRVLQLAPAAARANKATLAALAAPVCDIGALVQDAYAYAASAEHREGIDAFLGKRRARFASS